MDMADIYDKVARRFAEIQEQKLFQEKKQDGTLVEPVFIMHPIHKGIIKDSGLKIDVLWTPLCEKDKAYAVTDKWICENMRRNLHETSI